MSDVAPKVPGPEDMDDDALENPLQAPKSDEDLMEELLGTESE